MISIRINGEELIFPTREAALVRIIHQFPGANFKIGGDCTYIFIPLDELS